MTIARPANGKSDLSKFAQDAELTRILEQTLSQEIPRNRRIYVNRNLRMDQVDLVGFDMDYTLASYHLHRVEQLSFDLTVQKLVEPPFSYPKELLAIPYDRDFVMRGLVIDKEHGNLIKMDRFNFVGRVYHGRRLLDREERQRLYRNEKIRLDAPRYAWVDTLFALPEASIFAEAIELLEGRPELDYGKLCADIREAIDTVHRDGSLKSRIQAEIGHYVFRDPELGPALHKLRSAGKRLFLLTNSLWDYTQAVMSHLLDGALPEYPSWRNYFDFVVVGGAKPRFFTERHPFIELDASGALIGEASALERGRIYQGGNLTDFERMSGHGGDRVLYVGDHIFGDILKSKKSSLWRTCMIVQELEEELAYLEERAEVLLQLGEEEKLRARLEDALGVERSRMASLERRISREGSKDLEQERAASKRRLELLRRRVHELNASIRALSDALEGDFNRAWGLMFKEGAENSRFAGQVEDYACLYTSRVSNFLFTSPMEYFRAPRVLMAHELGLEPLSPYGADERLPGDALMAKE